MKGRHSALLAVVFCLSASLASGCAHRSTSVERAQAQFEANRSRYDAAARSIESTSTPPRGPAGVVALAAQYADLTPGGDVYVHDVGGRRFVVFQINDNNPDYFNAYVYASSVETIPPEVLGDGGTAARVDRSWWKALIGSPI